MLPLPHGERERSVKVGGDTVGVVDLRKSTVHEREAGSIRGTKNAGCGKRVVDIRSGSCNRSNALSHSGDNLE